MMEFFLNGGIPMYVINFLALILIIFTVERFVSLCIRKDFSPGNLERRLLLIRFIGFAAAIIGVIGTLLGIYVSFRNADAIIVKFGGQFPIYRTISIAISTSIWGLVISLLSVTVYFVIKAFTVKAKSNSGVSAANSG